MQYPADYISGDQGARDEAYGMNYRSVYQHPDEIGTPSPDDFYVFDADNVPFGDKDRLIKKAREAARAGASVAICTYYPEDPILADLWNEPNVIWAKTHLELIEEPKTAPAGSIKWVA